MNIKSDEFYVNLLDNYFMELYNTKLIKFFIKLDKDESEFTIQQPYEDALNYVKEEITEVMEVIDFDSEAETESEFDSNEKLGFVTSGFKNMNPALVHLQVKDNSNGTSQITMKSYCGEGLIKQKTNQKAFNTIEQYLNGDEIMQDH